MVALKGYNVKIVEQVPIPVRETIVTDHFGVYDWLRTAIVACEGFSARRLIPSNILRIMTKSPGSNNRLKNAVHGRVQR
jgi:hypothetical protein